MVRKFVINMKIFFFFSLLILLSIKSIGQQKNVPTSMHAFLQKNGDSTIIYHFQPSFLEAPEYLIISKKSDTISIYTYGSQYIRNRFNVIPKAIIDTLNRLHNYRDYVDSYNVGINKFFDVKYIARSDAKIFWNSLIKLMPWEIKDDKHDNGGGCPPNTKMKNYTADNGGLNIDLIITTEIKNLYFDDPWYYESKNGCRGNTNRLKALKIEKLFKTYFNNKYILSIGFK